MRETIQFTLNGRKVTLDTDGDRTLLWVLRSDLGMTGPKYGCGEGLCGSCTVLINDEAMPSCQMRTTDAAGAELVTIEGLAGNGRLHPLQEAFIEKGAFQCGYCTPGMILKAYSLLKANPNPSAEDIVWGLEDNLCRCGAHVRIVEAIQSAARILKGGAS